MTDEELEEFFEHILLRIQWQKFSPRTNKRLETKTVCEPADPVLKKYRDGKISKAEVCRYLGINEKDLLRTLVRMGELFGD